MAQRLGSACVKAKVIPHKLLIKIRDLIKSGDYSPAPHHVIYSVIIFDRTTYRGTFKAPRITIFRSKYNRRQKSLKQEKEEIKNSDSDTDSEGSTEELEASQGSSQENVIEISADDFSHESDV